MGFTMFLAILAFLHFWSSHVFAQKAGMVELGLCAWSMTEKGTDTRLGSAVETLHRG